jgi:hypothetical protein
MEDTKMSLNDIVKKTFGGVKTTGKKAYEIVKDTAKTVPALIIGAGLAYGTANADASMIQFREDDGVPVVYKDARPGQDALVWDIIVRNNSDVLPLGSAYNELCKDIAVFGLYSTTIPTFANINGWGFQAIEVAPNAYDIIMRTTSDDKAIQPGQELTFSVRTYVFDGEMPYIGNVDGQGALQYDGPQALDPFQGPIGPSHLDDVIVLAEHWLETGCIAPAECVAADFNTDKKVDYLDLANIAARWIATTP